MTQHDILRETLGDNNYNYVISKHSDVIDKFIEDDCINLFIKLYKSYNENLDFLNSFYATVRTIFYNRYKYDEVIEHHKVKRIVPSCFNSMNFTIKTDISSVEDLKNIKINNVFIMPKDELIQDKLGIDNIIRFEKDTGYFSRIYKVGYTILDFFNKFCYFAYNYRNNLEDRIPSYDEFLDIFKDYIVYLKRNKENGIFLDYKDLPDYFKDKYPDLFIDEEAEESAKIRFYLGELDLKYIEEHLDILPYIKDKNLFNVIFDEINIRDNNIKYNFIEMYSKKFGKEAFIELITSFGSLITLLNSSDIDFNVSKDEVDKRIRDIIYHELINNDSKYLFLANSKSFNALLFKKEHSDLFLEESAPKELKNAFYDGLSFKYISNNRRYLKLIKGKDYITSIIKKEDSSIKEFFKILNRDSFRLIINNPDTISKALSERELDKLCFWYIKTGRKYIPDYEIIKNFDVKDADKFINNRKKWKCLLKSLSFSEEGSKEILLKLSYLFGVFDNDDQGYKKLQELILNVPKHIKRKDHDFFDSFKDFLEDPRFIKVKKSFIKEGFHFTREDYIFDLYKVNKDGSYTLKINPQDYPKSNILLRDLMEECDISGLLTPFTCNEIFYNFKMSYNKEFKELFIENLDRILKDEVCRYYISYVQRKFEEIKSFYSNKKLTLDKCLNYVKNNMLENVDIGNELLADHLSKLGYDQTRFDQVQDIYNIGKLRIYSSIPRITGSFGKYNYEMVRLDSVLPVEVGDRTSCCQKIGQLGESCMIHSMTDKNGRLFVVHDKDGNLISESWVWRNRDTICFDNIEVPVDIMVKNGYKKAFFDRTLRTKFGDELLEVYLEASKELYLVDKEMYDSLYYQGIITKEQYEDLVLKKVTIGQGYSSIQGSLEANLLKDYDIVRPLPFTNSLYKDIYLYTRDSNIQYLVLNRKEKKSTKKSLYIYHDDYKVIEDDLSELEVFKIKREELEFNGDKSKLINLDSDPKEFKESLNNLYNSNNIKIVFHSCFTIIFDDSDKISIKDVFYNKDVDKKVILKMLKLAFHQLAQSKELLLDSTVTHVLDNIKKSKKLDYKSN